MPGVCPLLIGAGPTLNQRTGTLVGTEPTPGPVPWIVSCSPAIVTFPWSWSVEPLATSVPPVMAPSAWLFSMVRMPPESVEVYQCRNRHGTVHQVRTRRHRRLDRHFSRFGPPLTEKRLLASGTVAGSSNILVSLRALLREVFAALIANPRATLREGSGHDQTQHRPD